MILKGLPIQVLNSCLTAHCMVNIENGIKIINFSADDELYFVHLLAHFRAWKRYKEI